MVVAYPDVGTEGDEERGADGTNSPEPTEKRRPSDSSKEGEGSRELGSINGEGHPPESFISLNIRKVLCLNCRKNENAAYDDGSDGHEVHCMVGA